MVSAEILLHDDGILGAPERNNQYVWSKIYNE